MWAADRRMSVQSIGLGAGWWQNPIMSSWKYVLSLVAVVWAAAGTSAAPTPKPNFIVIFIDDLGYADLGCFGSPNIRTPNIDRLAKEGMRFTHFYAQPICGPSRAALMTGCQPMRVAEAGNVKNVHPVLHTREITIAEVLKPRGYASICVGKWDLAGHSQRQFVPELLPTRQGFDEFFGTPTSNDSFVDLFRNEERIEEKGDMGTLTQRYTDAAIDFVKRHRDQPFFVYLPHTMVHTKLAASPDFNGRSKRGLYGDTVEEIDHHTGRLMNTVRELGLTERTWVIFTSDNGPWLIKNKGFQDGVLPTDHGGSSGPLRSGKVSTWEGGQRVPCIAWAPGRIPAGTTCDRLASTLDVLPTLASLAGAAVPDDRVIDGENITHLLEGKFDQARPEKTFCYYLLTHLQAVRQGPWKLHVPRPLHPKWLGPHAPNRHIDPRDDLAMAAPQLYHLYDDPGETTDVAARHPEVVKQLLAEAEKARQDIGDHDRVGKGMRFFDPLPQRPITPPTAFGQPKKR